MGILALRVAVIDFGEDLVAFVSATQAKIAHLED